MVTPFIAIQGALAVQVGMMFLAPETIHRAGRVFGWVCLGQFFDRQYILDPSDMNRAYPVPMTDDRAVGSRIRSKTCH